MALTITNTEVFKDGDARVMKFDGATSVLTLGSTLVLGTEFTFIGWFALGDTGAFMAVAGFQAPASDSYPLLFSYGATTIYTHDGTSATSVIDADLFDGNWHQVGVVRNGTNVKFYLDGAQTGVDKTLGTNNALSINRIGNRNGAFNYAGKMSDVRAYSGLLTAAEISQMFTNERAKYNV